MRKYLRNLFLIFFVCAIAFASSAQIYASSEKSVISEIKSRGHLLVSTNADFQPFEYRDGNSIVGIDIDIAQKLADELGVELKIKDTSFDSLTLELKNRNCDLVIAAMSYSEEKAKNVEFSDPYFSTSQVVVVNADSTIKSIDDLSGKRIGVQFGTTGDTYCTANLKNSEMVRLNKEVDVFNELMSKKIDAVVIDKMCADRFVVRNQSSLKILDSELTSEEYRIAFPKGNSDLITFVNAEIVKLKQSGEIDAIVDKYNQNVNETFSPDYAKIIIKGLGTTLLITFFALIIGIMIATVISLMKILSQQNRKFKILGIIADLYTTIIRGTPVLVQLFIMYYIILKCASGDTRILAAILSFGINSGAYVAEIIRSGIQSVDKGQIEAGRSLGLSQGVTMVKIVFPQALKNILPALGNEFITLLKETSVAGYLGIEELSKSGDIIRALTYSPYMPLLTVAAIYLVMVVGLTRLLAVFERRLRKSDIR